MKCQVFDRYHGIKYENHGKFPILKPCKISYLYQGIIMKFHISDKYHGIEYDRKFEISWHISHHETSNYMMNFLHLNCAHSCMFNFNRKCDHS